MRREYCTLFAGIGLAASALAQTGLTLPKSVVAGSAFAVPTSGSGSGTLYIVGPGQALRQEVQLGQEANFAAGQLVGAGQYVAVLVTPGATQSGVFAVLPAARPATLGFLAKPSRLPVGLHNGISGAIYVFDAYHNLLTAPVEASLTLLNATGAAQTKNVTTRNGLAWTSMDSADKEGNAKFVAKVGDATSTRVIEEVPGDPCGISISAHPNGKKIEVQTAPVKDCGGNLIPDGTIVTFTETLKGSESTVDVPLKQGVARVDMPAYKGSTISVASGVVAGNEIRWEGR